MTGKTPEKPGALTGHTPSAHLSGSRSAFASSVERLWGKTRMGRTRPPLLGTVHNVRKPWLRAGGPEAHHHHVDVQRRHRVVSPNRKCREARPVVIAGFGGKSVSDAAAGPPGLSQWRLKGIFSTLKEASHALASEVANALASPAFRIRLRGVRRSADGIVVMGVPRSTRSG
jgi:hypothetical protein